MKHLNLLLVVFDSARRDRFGCYGYGRGTTPTVDELARRGLVFDRMITPAPWTVPSHASLFTGLYPREHGAHWPTPVVRKDVPKLADQLRDRGYTTASVSANPLLGRGGMEEGFQVAMVRRDVGGGVLRRRARLVLGRHDSGSEAVIRTATELLGEALRPPFFLFVNLMECHWPYFPPRRFQRRFLRQGRPWVRAVQQRARMRGLQAWDAVALADGDGLMQLNDLYDAGLATMDDRLGGLLDTVRRGGYADDTVTIVAADHGEHIGDHGLATHQGSLHATLIQVPFIASIPGVRPARLPGLAQFTDVFSGLCRLLGVEPPAALRDRAMAVDPFSMSPQDAGRPYAFAEWQHWGEQFETVQRLSPHFDLSVLPRGLEAAQDQRFKLIVRLDTGEERLYDLEDDPEERRDVAAVHPEELKRLRNALHEWREAHPAGAAAYTPDEVLEVESRLRELGYI